MILESPLNDEHISLGARLTEFGGWNMPLQYSSVLAEHRAVRESAGLFDVSHLGKISITGPDASRALDGILPGKVAGLAVGQAGYNLVLNEKGGIIDDIFVYRLPDEMLVVPNAANTHVVLGFLQDNLRGDLTILDARQRFAIIALSGPKVRDLVEPLVPLLANLKLHRFFQTDFEDHPALVARTGYTGEFTYEFFVSWQDSVPVWRRLLELASSVGGIAAGLGARDTLRLEMGYPLHGHEIDEQTDPLEAGMDWVIDWDKEFIGRPALESVRAKGRVRALVGLVAKGREIPRTGYALLKEGEKVGELASGNISPVLGRGIAMGYVPPDLAEPGTMLTVDVRGKTLEVEVTKPPFIKKR